VLDEETAMRVGQPGVISQEGVIHQDPALTAAARTAAASIEAERDANK
jgi:hypothetical protein